MSRTGKLLLALQTYAGDLPAAKSLLRLIADLAGGTPYTGADLLVVVRFDTPLPMEEIRYAAPAFSQVMTFRTTTKKTGYPGASNAMFANLWQHYVGKQSRGVWKYTGLYALEPDDVPLERDWLRRIKTEWEATTKLALGCCGARDGVQDHCNGNAVWSHELAGVIPNFPVCQDFNSWDVFHGPKVGPHAQPSHQIISEWRRPVRSSAELYAPRSIAVLNEWCQPAVLHGPKNFAQTHQWVREHCGIVPVLA